MGNSCSTGCGVAGDSDASFTPLPSDPAAFGALTGTALPHLLARAAVAELAALMKPLRVKAGTVLYGDTAGQRAYDGFFVCMSGAVDVDERLSALASSAAPHQRRVLPGDWFVADIDTAGVARGVSAQAVTLESDGARADGIVIELLHCSLTDFAQLGVDTLAELTPLLSRAFISPLLKSVWFLSALPAATLALVAAKARLTVFARGHALYDFSENGNGGSDMDAPLYFSLILGGRVRLTAQPVRDEVDPKKSLARADIPKSRLDAQSARDADMQLEQLLISSAAADEVSVTATKGWYGGTLALLRNVAPLGAAMATDPTLVLCLTRDDLTEALASAPASDRAAIDADFHAAAFAELERQRIMQRMLALRVPLVRSMPLEQIEAVIAAGSVCELRPNEHVYREGDDPRLTLVLAGSVQVRVPTTRAQRAASLVAQAASVDESEDASKHEDDEVATDRDSRVEVGRGVKVESADAHTQSSVVGSGQSARFGAVTKRRSLAVATMRSGGADSDSSSSAPSASAVCVTRVVFFSLAQDQFETLWTRNAAAAARVAVSLDKAGATLRVILNHPRAVGLFHRHVTAEYSPENYEFWKLVTDFQNSAATKSDAALLAEAKLIIDEYTGSKAPKQVNLKGHMISDIDDKMKSGKVTRTLFVEAKDEIFKLMNMDSFQRFKRGPHFQMFLNTDYDE